MSLYTATITLILIMDPLGNIPVFLALLRRYPPAKQRKILLRECFIALFILLVFLFFGREVLEGMGISSAALGIAGGVILFLISLKMIFPSQNEDQAPEKQLEPFIVPFAIPLIAGPSALAMVLLFVTREPHRMVHWSMAVLLAWLVFTVIMMISTYLMKVLGERGLIALERLMGMILTILAVQMLLGGLTEYLHSLH